LKLALSAVFIAVVHGVRVRRTRHNSTKSSSCASIGCFASYDRNRPCQCNRACPRYGNCCSDFQSLCLGPTPSPAPTPPYAPSPLGGGAAAYWNGINMNSLSAVKQRISSGVTKLSYSGLWTFYKSAWVNLPGQCQGKVFDVYSLKCWTPGTGQCGSYRGEGDCYNREHSWPKSWWGGSKNSAYSDVFHVMPSDGYVNGRRSAHPFGEVNSPSYTSREGHKVGSCSSGGGTCFEPTDRVKGLMARGTFYVNARYGYSFRTPVSLLLKWNSQHPPTDWEIEFNNRAQSSQRNRNPFIDFPDLASTLYG